MRVSVIGAGAWGTALAHVLASGGNDVKLWAYEEEVAVAVNEHHQNTIYLPEINIHSGIIASSSLPETLEGAEVVLSVSPSQVVRRVMSEAAPYVPDDALIVSASKGIENNTLMLMNEVLEEVLSEAHKGRVAALSGPSFAKETALEMPTAVSLAASVPEVANTLQEVFNTPFFRVYTLDDVVGVEVGGALKNVIALAAGVADGLGFGHNSRAALITRGIAEISRIGVELGANPLTFMGLSGIGDLVLTCTGDLSRNRTVGMRLGKGEKLKDILSSMVAVAEGVKTCDSTVALAKKIGVEMPIASKMWEVLHEEKNPQEGVEELMGRPLRREFWHLES
ncbi:MAG: glycerol-3-phosphate dehydrogenase [Deltaproteobacteria bacterium]|nr:MAG: glycerol-3-phosphate dehydrogenase [Deltaproteobacteria bacterium]